MLNLPWEDINEFKKKKDINEIKLFEMKSRAKYYYYLFIKCKMRKKYRIKNGSGKTTVLDKPTKHC